MNINLFLLFFLIGSAIDFTINSILEFIDYRHRKLHGKEIPEEVAGSLSNEDIEKTISYENTKFFTWIPHHIISFALSLREGRFCIYLYRSNQEVTEKWIGRNLNPAYCAAKES